MPSYSYTFSEGSSYPSAAVAIQLASLKRNEVVRSVTISSTISDAEKGKYKLYKGSHGNMTISLTSTKDNATYTVKSLVTLNYQTATTVDKTITLFSDINSFDASAKMKSLAGDIRLRRTNTNWAGTLESVTTWTFKLNTEYAIPCTIWNSDYGTATAKVGTYSGSYFPVGATVTLTPSPNKGYKLDRWEVVVPLSGLEITDNTFVMPDVNQVTIKPIFTPESPGYFDNNTIEPCIPMYYDGTKWIECDWKYYDGTNWNDGESI